MARSSFGKREREQTKKAKAAAKRERRQGGGEPGDESTAEAAPQPVSTESTGELLERIAAIHEQFEAGTLSYEDFEATKADLLSRLPVD
jgi:hypothetical protein